MILSADDILDHAAVAAMYVSYLKGLSQLLNVSLQTSEWILSLPSSRTGKSDIIYWPFAHQEGMRNRFTFRKILGPDSLNLKTSF